MRFEDFTSAVSAGSGWTVSSDRPAGPAEGEPASGNHEVILVFDGGSLGNPGKGYGSFAYKGRVVRWPTRVDFPGSTTNNQAEYQALIAGLRALIFDSEALGLTTNNLRLAVWSDSELLVKQITGAWKIKNVRLRELHGQARELLNRFAGWDMTWHPRSESVRILGH